VNRRPTIVAALALGLAAASSGCAVVTATAAVGSAAIAVGSAAVSVGVTAVGVAADVAVGTVKVIGSAVSPSKKDDKTEAGDKGSLPSTRTTPDRSRDDAPAAPSIAEPAPAPAAGG
jgi:D-arabinose 1-dehydrogenase-like Zn-dependent alcohol dehydrogenase